MMSGNNSKTMFSKCKGHITYIVCSMKKSEALNILGLKDGFSEDELKKAHRKKVVENHPDRFQDPTEKSRAEERTKLINEAHDVLKSGKWDPEYGPRAHSSTYGTPYRNPYTGQAQGAEWVEVDPEMFRRWAEQTAQQQQQQGYDPFNPFTATSYAAPSPEMQEARAAQDIRIWLIMFAVKVALCGIEVISGNYYDAALTWAVITYLLLIASRFAGCGWIVMLALIPVFYSTAGMLEAAAQQGGVFSAVLIGLLFVSSLYYDFRDLRDALRRRDTAKKKKAGQD